MIFPWYPHIITMVFFIWYSVMIELSILSSTTPGIHFLSWWTHSIPLDRWIGFARDPDGFKVQKTIAYTAECSYEKV